MTTARTVDMVERSLGGHSKVKALFDLEVGRGTPAKLCLLQESITVITE